MKNKKRNFSFAFFLIIIASLIPVFFLFSSLFNKPLGPSVINDLAGINDANINTMETPDFTSYPAPQDQPLLTQQALDKLTPLSTQGPPLCGNTPVLTVLVSGIDYRGENYVYGLADVIRIVRIDFTTPKISIFTLDRDLWVEIPDIQDHYDITHGKLNQAYFYGVPAMGYYDGSAGGAGLLARTIKWNFGLSVDNYAVVSMAAFVRGVDALGGIDVAVPYTLDGTGSGTMSFTAGMQHLDGEQALDLARIREGYSSLIRIANQDAIIKALTDTVTTPAVILKIPALIQALRGTILTDLSPDQINDLVCLAKKTNSSNLFFAEIPTGYYEAGNIFNPNTKEKEFIWNIDFNVIRQYVMEFQSGRWP